jgi:hypothetical protein
MASYFKIACPGCNKSLKVSENLAGKNRACPYCQLTFRIPENPFAEAEADAKVEPDSALPSIHVSEKPAAVAAKKKVVKRKQQQNSWFSSSSESASSDVSLVLSGLIGAAMTLVWYAITFPIRETYFGALFWQRGPIPLPTTFVMFWAVAILILKWRQLKQQKNAMLLDVLPTEVSREITLGSLDEFIDHINGLPGASADSFLINRVVRGIEHFRVRKSAAEAVTMMESQSMIDANNVAGSYTIVRVFIWALPILGFIGTVMGVSAAVASLAGSLSNSGSMDAMKAALQDVFGGLGTAFDTTLLALIMSMLVKIPASALQKSEEDLITSVDEYCNENLLRRLNDGREGGAERGAAGGGGDATIFREAVEQALATQHAELEQWLQKLDSIGGRLTSQVSKGWEQVNERMERQQQKQIALLHQQQQQQQAQMQGQLDQMSASAQEIQATLSNLAQAAATMQSHVNDTFSATQDSLQQHLAGVETGLTSLGSVLEKLGNGQVVVQQVEPKRGWFGRSKSNSRRQGSR